MNRYANVTQEVLDKLAAAGRQHTLVCMQVCKENGVTLERYNQEYRNFSLDQINRLEESWKNWGEAMNEVNRQRREYLSKE